MTRIQPGRTEQITNETKAVITAIASLLAESDAPMTLADIRGRMRDRSLNAIEYHVKKAERLNLLTIVYTERGMRIALRNHAWRHVKARRAA